MITFFVILICDHPTCFNSGKAVVDRFGPNERRVAEGALRVDEFMPEGWSMHSDRGTLCPEHS